MECFAIMTTMSETFLLALLNIRGVTVRQSFGSVRFGSVQQKTSVRFGFFTVFFFIKAFILTI